MSGDEWVVNSDQKKEFFLKYFEQQFEEHKHLMIKIKRGKQRTSIQNNSLHKYCELVASNLNAHGFDMHKTLSHDIEVPWTKELVKELIWKPVQKSQIAKESTTEAERQDYSKIYDIINRYLINRFEIYVPWPSAD